MGKKILITGSNGLIGSEVAVYFGKRGFAVHGVDNNQRAVFFGPAGDTRWNQRRLQETVPRFTHHEQDIRDRAALETLVRQVAPQFVVHTAAQPSHDRAAAIPFDDFDTNAGGTLNLLEACRRHCPEAPFVHMSTNKVYGDAPNRIPLVELEQRWEYGDHHRDHGISETCSIDQSLHSLFGASKVAADVMVQEYGRYFNLPTCCLRGGCLTGPNHTGVELHGFLSYLVKCNLEDRPYSVFGYQGKQVRDNIHSEDVAAFMLEFYEQPRCGEVYNLGGGRENSCSILEAFAAVERLTGRAQKTTYVDQNRVGDHVCYYSDLRKMKAHYPRWSLTRSLPQIFSEIIEAWQRRLPKQPMKLLVTGICGFAGSALALELQQLMAGLEIIGFDNLSRPGSELNRRHLRERGIRFVHGDIRNPSDLESLPPVDWVIDAAANPSVLAGISGPASSRQLMEHNLVGTLHLLEYCKRHRAGVVMLSTSRVYSLEPLCALAVDVHDQAFVPRVGPDAPPGLTPAGVSEEFSTRPPISLYGAAKLASETVMLEYGRAFDFPVFVNRCGVLAGAGQFGRPDQGIFAYWMHSFCHRRPLRYIGFGGSGHQVRDCLHPRDLATLLVRQFAQPGRAGNVINVSGGLASSISLAQLSRWCAARFGPHEVTPEPAARPYDIPWLVLDSARAAAEWGWQPAVSRENILDELARHAQEHPGWLDLSAGP